MEVTLFLLYFLPTQVEKSILSEQEVKDRMSKVIDTEFLEQAIQCLEEFDYCIKLQPEEEILYTEKGYLFPSLRPVGSFFLGNIDLLFFNDQSERSHEMYRNEYLQSKECNWIFVLFSISNYFTKIA